MNPPLDLHCNAPDPTASPINIVDLFALIDTHLSGEILGSYIPYVMGVIAPGIDDTDKIWLQLDSGGRPIALKKYYAGRWRRVYNGMLGEIRIFSGNPNNATLWDTDGRGQPEKEYDGWQICNGNNGSPNLTDKFVVAAHMDNSAGHTGYSSGWQTFIDGETDQKTGGDSTRLIENVYLPPIDGPAGTGKLVMHGSEYKSDADHTPDSRPIIDVHYANLVTHDATLATYGAAPNGVPATPQKEFPIIPTFIAMGYIIFVGYA